LEIGVTLVASDITLVASFSMGGKIKYWVPVFGVFISLVNYDKDNDMGIMWAFYQTVVCLALIFVITYFSIGK
jgi:hypothetical protein